MNKIVDNNIKYKSWTINKFSILSWIDHVYKFIAWRRDASDKKILA